MHTCVSFLLLFAVATIHNGQIRSGGRSETRVRITKDSSALAGVRAVTKKDEIKPKKGEKKQHEFNALSFYIQNTNDNYKNTFTQCIITKFEIVIIAVKVLINFTKASLRET